MKKIIKEVYLKNKEIINYLIFGVLSAAVNFLSFYLFNDIIGTEEITSNVIAWVMAVLFAYFTNKLYVFDTNKSKGWVKELICFFTCRVLSMIITDIGIFALLVKVLKINVYIVKLINQVIVTILNYVFSKLFVFRKGCLNE